MTHSVRFHICYSTCCMWSLPGQKSIQTLALQLREGGVKGREVDGVMWAAPSQQQEPLPLGRNIHYIIMLLKKKIKVMYRGVKPIKWRKFRLLIQFLIIIVLPLWPHTSCRPSLRFISSGILACVCSPLPVLSHRSDRAARGDPHCPKKLHARTKLSEQGECPPSCHCIYSYI